MSEQQIYGSAPEQQERADAVYQRIETGERFDVNAALSEANRTEGQQ